MDLQTALDQAVREIKETLPAMPLFENEPMAAHSSFRIGGPVRLPEFFNILKGDMSFIGPRPLLVKYLDHYNSFEMRRHEVRPGLTGLAQVNGRVALPWKRKFEMDIEYVDNVSFLMDLKILFQTVKKVFAQEGITYKQGNVIITDYFELHGADRAGEDK